MIFVAQLVTNETAWPAENTLYFSFKYLCFKNGTTKLSFYY